MASIPVPQGGELSDWGILGGFGGRGGSGDIPGGGSEDSADWEPQNPTAWAESDPLRPGALPGESDPYDPQALFAAFKRLPPGWLRAQAWRERQIAAYLIRADHELNWGSRLPNLAMYCVGRRPWEQTNIPGLREAAFLRQPASSLPDYVNNLPEMPDYAEVQRRLAQIPARELQLAFGDPLAAVFYFRPSAPPYLNPPSAREIYAALELPVLIDLAAGRLPLEIYGLSRYVPVVFSSLLAVQPLGSPPAAGAPNAGMVLQPGMQVSGVDVGTLTAIVREKNSPREYLLAPQHVLGDPGDPVSIAAVQVGNVVASDTALDWALADLTSLQGAYTLNRNVLGLSMAPSVPVMPTYGLAGQYCGQKTARATYGFVSGVYNNPPQYLRNLGAHIRGECFEMDSGAQGGDSGALVLGGQGQTLPLSPDYKYHPPARGQHRPGDILGMLVAQMPAWGPFTAKILAVPAEKITSGLQAYIPNGYQIQWV